jgi:hypothetical protein
MTYIKFSHNFFITSSSICKLKKIHPLEFKKLVPYFDPTGTSSLKNRFDRVNAGIDRVNTDVQRINESVESGVVLDLKRRVKLRQTLVIATNYAKSLQQGLDTLDRQLSVYTPVQILAQPRGIVLSTANTIRMQLILLEKLLNNVVVISCQVFLPEKD